MEKVTVQIMKLWFSWLENKYIFDPYLKVENNKLVIKCYVIVDDDNDYLKEYKTLYFDLKN